MRRPVFILTCLLLFCILLPGSAPAETGLAEVRCDPFQFSTRIPAGWHADPYIYTDDELDRTIAGGILLTADGPENPPQIRILRRNFFHNVQLYLTSYYWQDLYQYDGSDSQTCRSFRIGGKTLYGTYAVVYNEQNEEQFREIRLIPVSNHPDTEFIAQFRRESEESVMALLDTVIRYYQPDEAPQKQEAMFLPASRSGLPEPDLQDHTYLLRVEDTDRIEKEGYFTAALYQRDQYTAEDLHAMKPGDTILIMDRVLTITGLEPNGINDDGSWYEVDLFAVDHSIFDESFRFTFEQAGDAYVAYFGNDNYSASRVGAVRIPFSVPDKVVYYHVFDDEYTLYSEDLLNSLGKDPVMFGFGWTEYNHSAHFQDGHLVRVETWSYPYDPEDIFVP